ncbi:hypothetical protein ACFLY6_00685 [Candidatus Dependentiae bacterium]
MKNIVKYSLLALSIFIASSNCMAQTKRKTRKNMPTNVKKMKTELNRMTRERDTMRDRIRDIAAEIATHRAAIDKLKNERKMVRERVMARNETIRAKRDQITTASTK